MKKITRREFLIMSGAGAAGILLGGCAMTEYTSQEPEIGTDAYSIKDDTVEVSLDKVPSLGETGGAATIVDNTLPTYLIIARVKEDEYVVASSRCTHRGMALGYDHKNEYFKCSSAGGSKFALDGSVLGGAAPDALKIFGSSVEQGVLTIELAG